MAVPKFLANASKLQNSALVTAVSLGVIELAAHIRHLTVPMLDQAFIAAIGVLFAPQGDKPTGDKKEGDGGGKA